MNDEIIHEQAAAWGMSDVERFASLMSELADAQELMEDCFPEEA